jgi:hypothetical protein
VIIRSLDKSQGKRIMEGYAPFEVAELSFSSCMGWNACVLERDGSAAATGFQYTFR